MLPAATTAPAPIHPGPPVARAAPKAAAEALIARVLGARAREFTVSIIPATDGKNVFEIESLRDVPPMTNRSATISICPHESGRLSANTPNGPEKARPSALIRTPGSRGSCHPGTGRVPLSGAAPGANPEARPSCGAGQHASCFCCLLHAARCLSCVSKRCSPGLGTCRGTAVRLALLAMQRACRLRGRRARKGVGRRCKHGG